MAKLTREASTAMTRQRLLREARRLFRERGYAATSLEHIAAAADVTKGAIYGHFSSKEDLLLSAIEAAPTADYSALLNDQSRPVPDRLSEFGRLISVADGTTDRAEFAVTLEFLAALLRNPAALRRLAGDVERRLTALADADEEQPRQGTTKIQAWAIGQALFAGLQMYQFIVPELLTPAAWGRAFELLAGLYPEP